ncbi:MAG: ribonuclease P protein component [Erythrobacter sp.]
MPTVLTKRADFLAANKGLRNARVGFVLLTRPNGGEGVRYGITVTKKIGNAVVRNRMKRRFRELLRAALPEHGLADTDHVMIGRAGGVERDFHTMAEELEMALARAAEGKGDGSRGRRPRRGNKSSPHGESARTTARPQRPRLCRASSEDEGADAPPQAKHP